MKSKSREKIGYGMNLKEKQDLIRRVLDGKVVEVIDTEKEYGQIAKMLNGNIRGDKITFNSPIAY